ncbi:MAG: hypothetical protein HY929_00455 [Euryarchaeota archaeon]|nr:hypothetical protein [Euryarchaeota archaeon]
MGGIKIHTIKADTTKAVAINLPNKLSINVVIKPIGIFKKPAKIALNTIDTKDPLSTLLSLVTLNITRNIENDILSPIIDKGLKIGPKIDKGSKIGASIRLPIIYFNIIETTIIGVQI